MKFATLTIALLIGLSITVTPIAARQPPAAQAKPKSADVVITEADHAKKVRVKKGDLIDVRLLAGIPSYWLRSQPSAIVRSQFKVPQSQPAPQIGNVVSFDGRYICVNRFEIVGESDDPVILKMMYCAPATEAERLEQVKPADPTDLGFWTRRRIERETIKATEFRPGLAATELKEGMVFQVQLQTKDDPPKVQK